MELLAGTENKDKSHSFVLVSRPESFPTFINDKKEQKPSTNVINRSTEIREPSWQQSI